MEMIAGAGENVNKKRNAVKPTQSGLHGIRRKLFLSHSLSLIYPTPAKFPFTHTLAKNFQIMNDLMASSRFERKSSMAVW